MSSLVRNVGTIGGLTAVSRVFGFIRDMMLSRVLGAGLASDAWQLAFTLPNTFRRLFTEGAFSVAFVPMYTRALHGDEGEEAAARFANDVLARPLGFTLAEWPRDPQGIYFGGNDMLMTPRQMLSFGELYLNGGAFGGRQIVRTSWVTASCDGRARNRRPGGPGFDAAAFDPMRDRKYGYGWWVSDVAGYQTCFAWGYGGQYIFVVPALDLVVVTTSSSTVDESRRSHRRTVLDIVEQLVIERIRSSADL